MSIIHYTVGQKFYCWNLILLSSKWIMGEDDSSKCLKTLEEKKNCKKAPIENHFTLLCLKRTVNAFHCLPKNCFLHSYKAKYHGQWLTMGNGSPWAMAHHEQWLTISETVQSNKWSEVKSLSRVRLFVTPWTVAYQAPLSMGFSRQNTGVGYHFLLQRIFPTQGSNLGPPYRRQRLLLSEPPGKSLIRASA